MYDVVLKEQQVLQHLFNITLKHVAYTFISGVRCPQLKFHFNKCQCCGMLILEFHVFQEVGKLSVPVGQILSAFLWASRSPEGSTED